MGVFFKRLALFLIGSLHTMIFAIFQTPQNFLLGQSSTKLVLICKAVLYTFAIGTSLGHQLICRTFGLRKVLLSGLFCNFFGIAILFITHGEEGPLFFIFLDMIFFGIALASVINSLITYIVLELPKKVGFGVIILFAFFNLGVLLAPFFLESAGAGWFQYPFLMGLLAASLGFIHFYFPDPPQSKREIHLKKGSLIWKLLHYRLAFFVIAIIGYGLAETTFHLWGYAQIESLFGANTAENAGFVFWMFLIIGQVFLLIPLQFFSANRVFAFLILMVLAASFFFPMQERLGSLLFWLAGAGFGCSAIFPILLYKMEKELAFFFQSKQLLSYLEKGISLMIAGYFIGVGAIDLWVEANLALPLSTHFHLAALFIAISGLSALFLNLTAPKL